jgi:uncharacterized membrane protein
VRRRDDLSVPRAGGRSFGIHYDPEAFGAFSEVIARALGTARYLVFQTVVVSVWIVVNVAFPSLRFDPYPFILLTLALSLQASYAAPLILLAQNRQADRDRAETDRDRETSVRTQADAEFIARELASVRLALSDVVTTEDLHDALADLRHAVARLEDRISPPPPAAPT